MLRSWSLDVADNGANAMPGGWAPGPRAREAMVERNRYRRFVRGKDAQWFKRPSLHTSLWLILVVTGDPGVQVDGV